MALNGPAMHSKPRTGCWGAEAKAIYITSDSVFKQFTSNQYIVMRTLLRTTGHFGQAMTLHDITQTLACIQQDGYGQKRACSETLKS